MFASVIPRPEPLIRCIDPDKQYGKNPLRKQLVHYTPIIANAFACASISAIWIASKAARSAGVLAAYGAGFRGFAKNARTGSLMLVYLCSPAYIASLASEWGFRTLPSGLDSWF